MWKKFRWDMFVTSFLPLWLSVIVFDIWGIVGNSINIWDKNNKYINNIANCLYNNCIEIVVTITVLLMALISIVGVNDFLKQCKTKKNHPIGIIKRATKANKLSSEFLLAYILPMIAFNFGKLQDVILFLIYFSVLAYLCIRNNNIYTNILLEFKGYKMYNCDIECSVLEKAEIYHDSLIISKEDLTQMEGNKILYWDFENNIYITIDKEGI